MKPSTLLRQLLARLMLPSLCLRLGEEGDGETEGDPEPGDDGTTSEGEDATGADDHDLDDDPDADPDADPEADPDADPDAEGDLVVSLDGETEPEEEPGEQQKPWVNELRKRNRELVRKQRENEAEIARLKGTTTQPAAIVVGEKPTIESCGWDGEKLDKELNAWHERKRAAEKQEEGRTEAEKAAKAAWDKTVGDYGTAKTALKVTGFAEAEANVQDALSPTQQGIVLDVLPAKQAALFVFALGNAPQKLKELAAITNPVKFAAAVGKLEEKVMVKPRKAPPAPERQVRSSVPAASAVDSQADRLRKEARQTGDYSKVADYRRQQDAKKQKKQAA